MIVDIVAGACLVWYFLIIIVCAIGVFQIHRSYSSPPPPPVSPTLGLFQTPHITILRPVRGLEPYLYECLAATFRQAYPAERLKIYFCVSSHDDPAFPILESLLNDFPDFDAKILVEDEDPNLSGSKGRIHNLGPNPKIRNMSRGYREAKGDIMWIIDCNVWISPLTAGNMVDLLCGFARPTSRFQKPRKYKFVHQLPLVIDVSSPSPNSHPPSYPYTENNQNPEKNYGAPLDEAFLSTAHAKFYTAISLIAIAPCIVGKSNMFRRSHLNALTKTNPARDPGIDYFSDNICEDHLIGDLLWRKPVPASIESQAESEGRPASTDSNHLFRPTHPQWGNHALLPHSLAIQPVANIPLNSYLSRRIRWLRVRKFTVTLATLVEPGTESLVCSAYGAFGLTTFSWCSRVLGIPQTWTAFFILWFTSVIGWMLVDYLVWNRLQSGRTLGGTRADVPTFVNTGEKKSFKQQTLAWLGREILAFPIWTWAFFGGVTVVWRGRRFWVGMDMKVHEIQSPSEESEKGPGAGAGPRVRENRVGGEARMNGNGFASGSSKKMF